MKKLLLIAALALGISSCQQKFSGKEILFDFDSGVEVVEADTCILRARNVITSDNFAVFLDDRFGGDISNPPALGSADMSVDVSNLLAKLESFYSYYRDTLQFVGDSSLINRYRINVFLLYSLQGTAFGGHYKATTGAFWAAPNRLKDSALNCVAHELGHCFQMQDGCDRRVANGISADDYAEWPGYSFYESAAQWMLWQVNPNWISDEKYHWDAFRQQPYKSFLSWENCYHSPYVLQYWAERSGKDIIGRIFREAHNDENAIQAYQRIAGLSYLELAAQIHEANCHTVRLDFAHARRLTRKFAAEDFANKYDSLPDGSFKISDEFAPEDFGFNVWNVPLMNGSIIPRCTVESDSADVRMLSSLVVEMSDGLVFYWDPEKPVAADGVKSVSLVVTAVPNDYKPDNDFSPEHKPARYSYTVKFTDK